METKKTVLQIEGMSCLSCAATIEKSLSKLNGVSNPAVNFTTGKASLGYNFLSLVLTIPIVLIELLFDFPASLLTIHLECGKKMVGVCSNLGREMP